MSRYEVHLNLYSSVSWDALVIVEVDDDTGTDSPDATAALKAVQVVVAAIEVCSVRKLAGAAAGKEARDG